jgi:serine/threonine protein kinase
VCYQPELLADISNPLYFTTLLTTVGTLATVAQTPLTAAQILGLFKQCVAGVEACHSLSPPMIHRDIKLENFLLTADGTVKLCDFGSATEKLVSGARFLITIWCVRGCTAATLVSAATQRNPGSCVVCGSICLRELFLQSD